MCGVVLRGLVGEKINAGVAWLSVVMGKCNISSRVDLENCHFEDFALVSRVQRHGQTKIVKRKHESLMGLLFVHI